MTTGAPEYNLAPGPRQSSLYGPTKVYLKVYKYTCLLCEKPSNVFQYLYLCFEGMQANPKGVSVSCYLAKGKAKSSENCT